LLTGLETLVARLPAQRSDLEALAAVIARSPIVVARVVARLQPDRRLPAGFEDVDVAILEWIAAEDGAPAAGWCGSSRRRTPRIIAS
jgi:hypothetical protein